MEDERLCRNAEHRCEIAARGLNNLLEHCAPRNASLCGEHLGKAEPARLHLGIVYGNFLPRVERSAPLHAHDFILCLEQLECLAHRRTAHAELLTQLPLSGDRGEIGKIRELPLYRIADFLMQTLLLFAGHNAPSFSFTFVIVCDYLSFCQQESILQTHFTCGNILLSSGNISF